MSSENYVELYEATKLKIDANAGSNGSNTPQGTKKVLMKIEKFENDSYQMTATELIKLETVSKCRLGDVIDSKDFENIQKLQDYLTSAYEVEGLIPEADLEKVLIIEKKLENSCVVTATKLRNDYIGAKTILILQVYNDGSGQITAMELKTTDDVKLSGPPKVIESIGFENVKKMSDYLQTAYEEYNPEE